MNALTEQRNNYNIINLQIVLMKLRRRNQKLFHKSINNGRCYLIIF